MFTTTFTLASLRYFKACSHLQVFFCHPVSNRPDRTADLLLPDHTHTHTSISFVCVSFCMCVQTIFAVRKISVNPVAELSSKLRIVKQKQSNTQHISTRICHVELHLILEWKTREGITTRVDVIWPKQPHLFLCGQALLSFCDIPMRLRTYNWRLYPAVKRTVDISFSGSYTAVSILVMVSGKLL